MSDPSSYVYQVLNWDRLFENNKSRERDQLHFVCVPNKQDGMGLTRVLNHPNGAAIYGIWQLILGACSRQTRPRDGWLTDTGRAPDGQEAGTPWTPEDLALRWRRPVAEIEETLRVLSAPNIQWIRALPLKVPVECPDSALQVPVRCLGTEREGTNGTEPPIPPEGVPCGLIPELTLEPEASEPDEISWTPIQIRLNAIFKRRPTTQWSKAELRAFKNLGQINEEDLRLVEAYYAAKIPTEKDYRRHDLCTLLNNFPGEVDRARNFKPATVRCF